MDEQSLIKRFMKFALDVYKITQLFPKENVYFKITDQLIRCSSSPAANYRAACRAKSGPDFINKLKIVEEELDESLFWLKYTNGVNSKWISITEPLLKEGNELLSITVASIKTTRRSVYGK
jgi:four helix bundle protein